MECYRHEVKAVDIFCVYYNTKPTSDTETDFSYVTQWKKMIEFVKLKAVHHSIIVIRDPDRVYIVTLPGFDSDYNKKQEQLTDREHLHSPPLFGGVRVAYLFIFYVM